LHAKSRNTRKLQDAGTAAVNVCGGLHEYSAILYSSTSISA